MTALVTQILGCLLVAAGIGFAVGWLLRHRSAVSNDHQLTERETELRVKGQALDTALYELKVKTSSLLMLESKTASLESLGRSAHPEVVSRQERIERLQRELKDSQAQAVSSQAEYQAQQQRLAEQDIAMAAFANEVRQANAAPTKAQEELLHKDQEILELQERLAEAAAPRAEIDRLRAHISELEPAQGRVHWLEVQLSERDAQHRRAVQLLETEIAARDRRLAESAQQAELLAERDRRIDTLERR